MVLPSAATSQEQGAQGGLRTGGARELIREEVEVFRAVGEAATAGRTFLARSALPGFYEARGFTPAWTDADRGLRRVDALLRAVRRADDHGLDPEVYHLAALDSLAAEARTQPLPRVAADLDLLATDAFLVLGSHLLHGRVNPESINPEWLANRRSARLDTILARAIETERIEETLYGLAPQQERYRRMLAAAAILRGIVAEGGWDPVVGETTLEPGSRGPDVAALRRRLAASGDLPDPVEANAGTADPELFDAALEQAVRRFQTRHGLTVDGIVGAGTRRALNVPARTRLRQVHINLERWRWLPEQLGTRHIEVNIPGFDVRVVERGDVVATHRAVVGRPYRATPMFSGTMTYLVLAPYWHVPPTIAAQDKLPAIKADPGVIARDRMTLLELGTDVPVDPSTVDWSSMTGSAFNSRFRLRQDPGAFNALGNVKFMFPNRHNVYLHDTPGRELFDRTARDFSSGCIRVERPLELAEYLLRDRPGWNRDRIEETVRGGVERTVPLSEPLQVHLLYWTAWMDEEGMPHFRDDIYGRDDVVWRALTAPAPVE